MTLKDAAVGQTVKVKKLCRCFGTCDKYDQFHRDFHRGFLSY